MKNMLVTYGIGLRWEFKHNVNLRIDYGFGKQTGGFVFNIGEAFWRDDPVVPFLFTFAKKYKR
ncbi:MAG: hypothetical protein LBF08_07485 [Dysgonamonadaceae bacterium]|jgi:hypothetical protein|nr:hypothetical protein [Dysgonamonadaceae bacterium]